MMNRKTPKILIKIGLLASSMGSFCFMGLSPILAIIGEAFPDAGDSLVQMIFTVPNLAAIFISPLCGTLMLRFRKKYILIASILFYLTGGLFSFFFHSSIWFLLAGSLIIGVGVGLMMVCVTALICELFDGQERGTLIGLNSTFMACGALICIFVSGQLAKIHFHYSYLLFLIMIPVLLLVIFFVPAGEKPVKKDGKRNGGWEMNPHIAYIMLTMLVFFILHNAYNSNSAMLISEYGLGDTTQASLVSMANTIGGICAGLSFGFILKKMKGNVTVFATVMAAIGFLLAFFIRNLIPIAGGSFLDGFGHGIYAAGTTYLLSRYLKQANTAFMLAISSAVNNGGSAISPYIVNSCAGLFAPTVRVRFIFCAVGLLIVAVITLLGALKWQRDC